MNPSSPIPISDELLSAYIDGDVSDVEKQQVELAIATDPEIAWQVETLRQTVALLRSMPSIPLPRSFVLQEEQVADVLHARRTVARPVADTNRSLWQRTLGFFNSGNLALRNATAIAATLFVVITLSRTFMASGPMTPMVAQPEQAVMFEAAPAASSEGEVAASSALMDEAPGSMESQDAESAEMPAAAARSMSAADVQAATEAQPAAEEESAAAEEPLPRLTETARSMAYQTAQVTTPTEVAVPEAAALRIVPEPQPTPEPQPVPEAAEIFSLESPAADEPESGAPDMGMARSAPASDEAPQTESAPAEEAVTGIAGASESEVVEPSVELFTTEAADVDPPAATKAVTEEAAESEGDEIKALDAQSTPVPTEEPQATEISMANESASDVGEQEGQAEEIQVANPATVSADSDSRWDLWQIMQIGVLALALILLLLWLGSRRRSVR